MGKKLIICGGASYTSGHELAADLLVPGYSKNTYTLEWDERTTARKELSRLLINRENQLTAREQEVYTHESKRRAWPSKLGQLVNEQADVVNCARNGLSNEEVAWRVSEIYNHAIKNIPPEDITVIIMPANFFRFGIPTYENSQAGWQSFSPHHFPASRSKVAPIAEYIFNHLTDYDHLWRSTIHLLGIQNYVKALGSNLIFVGDGSWDLFFQDYKKENQESVANIKTAMDVRIQMFNRTGSYYAMMHYPEEAHQMFAEEVEKLLTENQFLG
jgi:hypothetical protein